ncbi:MAG: hypothetical protein WBG38_05215 [Nodosilinea sp.]
MYERPIRTAYRGPATNSATHPATGGENLGALIAEVEGLRIALGYSRWVHLKAWCDDGDPLTTDQGGLERLIERLCIVWEGRGNG